MILGHLNPQNFDVVALANRTLNLKPCKPQTLTLIQNTSLGAPQTPIPSRFALHLAIAGWVLLSSMWDWAGFYNAAPIV